MLLLLTACLNSHDAQATQDPAPGAVVGSPAPTFTGTDLDGNEVSLPTEGTVVLEWFNPGCPFVKYAHGDDGPLQGMAAEWSAQGVTWLAINSGAGGNQGTGVETNRKAATEWKMEHPILLDESGAIGHLYGASTTPEVAIIHDGTLVYWGGLDNAPRGKAPSEGLVPHAAKALTDVKEGRPVAVTTAKPYGCSVKY